MDSSIAFRRFLLLGRMAEDADLYEDYIRQALHKYFQWLSPKDQARVAELEGSDIDTVLSTEDADPKPLYEVKKGGRDFEIRQPMLEMAIREALENPLELYGPQGWFIAFARWTHSQMALPLSLLDPILYLILLAHQLLAHPRLRLQESVRKRAFGAWIRVFKVERLSICGAFPPKEVMPEDVDGMRVLTDLMDDVLARLDPPLDRLALCEELHDSQQKPIENDEFKDRWNDLLNLLQGN
ncbi:hypothetical protein PG999_005434 [Apiospora kogelbergensis]|uniref:Uncharacterized protein n=1 Tax=Apiospora kogelbergensis TaxID=1337665 RepID=A0AAW0R293_9PEZI